MKREEFAARLNGRQYRDEITIEEEQQAKENNLIVIFGASDDLIEFRGAIYDEIDAWDGVDFFIATPGTEVIIDKDEETYKKVKSLTPVISRRKIVNESNFFQALWSPDELDCSWLIKTDIPHSTFDIMEDDDLYCRGVVVSVSDLK